jgi:hypothetical protein
MHRLPRTLLTAATWLAASAPLLAQSSLQTRAERTAYRETSSYADVMAFIDRVASASDVLHRTTFGYTSEGRSLPLVIVARGVEPTPASIRASGKTVVYLQGNIHGGEVCGKEALQMLLRDVAEGRREEWLDDLVLLVAPIYNVDGNERVALTNRPRQNGPYGGMGQRPNAQGFDLNRDHMKLDSPEARSVAALFTAYDPHVAVDLHTTNGTRHAYHLTYSPPLHPNTPMEIDRLLRDELLPRVTENVRAEHGWEFYYYGNSFSRDDAEPGWYTFDHRPRFNNNYVGLRNRIAILGEAYAYATFEERVLASLWLTEEILDFAAERSADIRRVVSEVDAPVVGETLSLRATFRRSDAPVDILMGEVDESVHPLTGRTVLTRRNVQRVQTMHEFGSFEATLSAVAPAGYVVPPDQTEVLIRLEAHGVRTEAMEAGPRTVEVFQIDSVQTAVRAFQGHNEQALFGSYRSGSVDIAEGSRWVPLDQPLGRLVFTLLEPQSDDGFANWALLAEPSVAGSDYPIVRVPGR